MDKSKEKKLNVWTIVLLVAVIILVVMGLVSNAIEIGERLRKVSVYLEIVFYCLIIIVVFVGIVHPIFGVFFAPEFSLSTLCEERKRKDRAKWCKQLKANLNKNVELTSEDEEKINAFLYNIDVNVDQFANLYKEKITPLIDKASFEGARNVFIITAISQNALIDMLQVAYANFNLIYKIVQICGFRPNKIKVARLFFWAFNLTLLAGGLEEADLEELIPEITEGALGKTFGLVAASASQGIVNAFTTLCMASAVKHRLLDTEKTNKSNKEIKKASRKEAVAMVGKLIKDGFVNKIAAPVKNVFSRKKENDSREEGISDDV